MESATFRKWLTERGCRFDRHEHEKRGEGQVIVTVHREGRKAEVPLGGSHQTLDLRVVRQACEELGLDWSRLPGPKSRVQGNRAVNNPVRQRPLRMEGIYPDRRSEGFHSSESVQHPPCYS